MLVWPTKQSISFPIFSSKKALNLTFVLLINCMSDDLQFQQGPFRKILSLNLGTDLIDLITNGRLIKGLGLEDTMLLKALKIASMSL